MFTKSQIKALTFVPKELEEHVTIKKLHIGCLLVAELYIIPKSSNLSGSRYILCYSYFDRRGAVTRDIENLDNLLLILNALLPENCHEFLAIDPAN